MINAVVVSTANNASLFFSHAGYTYCGACAAHAYKQVDPSVT